MLSSPPVIDQSSMKARNGREGDARLTDAAAGEGLGEAVVGGGGDGGVGHPHLRALPAGGVAGRHRLAEERPLDAAGRAVGAGEGGGHVPPLDAEAGVGAVVAREGEARGRGDGGEAFGVGGEVGVALGGGARGEGERQGGEGGAEAAAAEARCGTITAHC